MCSDADRRSNTLPVKEFAENIDEHTLDGKGCSMVAFAFSILKTSSDSLATE